MLGQKAQGVSASVEGGFGDIHNANDPKGTTVNAF